MSTSEALADKWHHELNLSSPLNPNATKERGVQGKLKSMQINMNDVGRSVDEALRLLDAFQYVSQHGVVCPANWKPGGETMLPDPDGSLKYFSQAESSQEEAPFAELLPAITSEAHFHEVISGSKPVVVRVPLLPGAVVLGHRVHTV